MDIRRHKLMLVSGGLAVLLLVASQGFLQAKDGLSKLRVIVKPVETEVFIDGQHMGDATYNGTLQVPDISSGEHTVELRNWGYDSQMFKLNFEPGKATYLEARLEPHAGEVTGPLGQLDVKGHHRAAILLNGTSPAYEVAHGGEAHGRFHSKLLVPPGTYQMAMVHGDKTLWSGAVSVQEGHRTYVDTDKGTSSVSNAVVTDPPEFRGHLLRSEVVVGKTTATFAASPATINCGDSSQLNWSTTYAVDNDISGIGTVPASGQQQVSPTATTTYTLTAKGPGGIDTETTTVTVNNSIDATLTVTPAEVTYPGTATLSWSVTGPGAMNVSIDPIGKVDASGSQQITVENAASNTTYTLHATNQCGGEITRTATLQVSAAAAPPPPEAPVPQAEAPKELPKTASDMPLLGLIGLASLGAGLALHQALKRIA